MFRFRFLVAVVALGLAGTHPVLAQTKTHTTTKPKAKAKPKPTAAKPAPQPAAAPAKPATPAAPALPPLTADDANGSLHEAMVQSITRGAEAAAQPDGFNGNTDIRIPFPPEAELVSTTLRSMRLGALVDNFEVALNRSAEAAAAQAKPIFLSAAQGVSFQDAVGLVTTRQPDAATQYLRRTTEAQLTTALQPVIQQSLDQTGAARLYAEMVARYNKLPLVTPLTANLTPYATLQTLNGLFTLIGQEEGRIRINPTARTSELLRRAFGRK